MLSTRFSIPRAVRATGAACAMAVLAACGTMQTASTGGVAVDAGQPVKVALLVPLGSGNPATEAIGRSLVNAAQLAQADVRGATIDLVVYNTGGSAGGGTAAASQAVAEGAKIIVGPLFSTATAGAQGVAAQAGLQVLSFSNNTSVAGGNVHILGNTFDNTASRLVGYGLSRGLQNFAVVYPNGLEGETARNAVTDAVRRRGANLVDSESYNVSVAGIQSAAGPIAAALQGNGAQAVILTDGPTGGLAYIAQGLRDSGLSPAAAQYLGMQRWDVSAEALQQPGLQGGVFAAPDPAYLGAFYGRYQNAYGESPHELASLAFDAIAAVGALIAEARSDGGSPFSPARITQPSGFAGAGGPFRFNPDGTNQRNLAVLEVRSGQAVVVERAARSFDAVSN